MIPPLTDEQIRVKVVSAPTLEELVPSTDEQETFERLVRWQEESARSTTKLGVIKEEKV